jgi:hypothetical protein
MGMDHRSFDIAMARRFLNRSSIIAAFEDVWRKGMLKNMSVALCGSQEMARFGALFLGECNNLFALLVQGFRSNVRPVGPSDGASFNSCLPEEIAVLEGLENGSTLQVLREINDSTRAIIKNDQETIVCFVLNLFDLVQNSTWFTSIQWVDLLDFLPCLGEIPIFE